MAGPLTRVRLYWKIFFFKGASKLEGKGWGRPQLPADNEYKKKNYYNIIYFIDCFLKGLFLNFFLLTWVSDMTTMRQGYLIFFRPQKTILFLAASLTTTWISSSFDTLLTMKMKHNFLLLLTARLGWEIVWFCLVESPLLLCCVIIYCIPFVPHKCPALKRLAFSIIWLLLMLWRRLI